MGRRGKKKKLKVEESSSKPEPELSPSNPPTHPHPYSPIRNWPDLPEPLLVSIADRISSAPDLLSFAFVCRSFLAAASAISSPPGPPLLLNPVLSFLRPSRLPLWSEPPRSRLQTLTSPFRSYSSCIAPRTLTKRCVGYSHSHLIFFAGSVAVLADPFTGREIRSPIIPVWSQVYYGILTAPPSSPSCFLLLISIGMRGYYILRWSPSSGGEWTELKVNSEMQSLAVFNGQAFGLDGLNRLIAVDFEHHQMSCRTLLQGELPGRKFPYNHGKFGGHLVECDEQLLLVLIIGLDGFLRASPSIQLYSLDLLRSEWVKKESLGDWCLFIDAVGKCSVSCKDPQRWGGRKNSVYIAGPGCDGWSVFPVDGQLCDDATAAGEWSEFSVHGEQIDVDDSPLNPRHANLHSWPSPVWVYPNMLL